jgi:putative nucleotidyltransferase with HDIG domain
MSQAVWARDLARSLLEEPLPRRWSHTQGVAAQAERLENILGADTDLVTAAAWLHDIGYSPALARTGLHPLDGARYLRDVEKADQRVCRLVAHHSCAVVEADQRGLVQRLVEEFAPEQDVLTKVLIYCDMTTDPDGRTVTFDERLNEIQERYGPDHLMSRSMRIAAPTIRNAIAEVDLLRSRTR